MGISQSLQKARTDHPRFVKVQYGAQSDITVIHIQVSDTEMKQWRQKYNRFIGSNNGQQSESIQSRIKLSHPNLLLIPQSDIRLVRDGFCNSSYKLLIKLEQTWSTNLMQEIKNRQKINRFYSEPQIWLILLTIVSTIVQIHQKSTTSILGNIHPSNILLNTHGEILIIGQVSLPKQKDHFQTYKTKGVKCSFVSPEMIGFLTNKSYKQYPHYPSCVDSQKAEAYCLGLTLMSLCCLQTDLSTLYMPQSKPEDYIRPHVSRQASSRHNYTNLLNLTFFNQMIHFIETHYSKMLTMVIKCLLQNKPEDRLSIVELWNVLLYQNKGYINAMDGKWFGQVLEIIDQNRQNSICENQDEKSNHMEYQVLNNFQYPFKEKIKQSIDLDLSKIEYQNNTNIINYQKSLLDLQKLHKQQNKNNKIVFTYN